MHTIVFGATMNNIYKECNVCHRKFYSHLLRLYDDGFTIRGICKDCELPQASTNPGKICEQVKELVYGDRALQYGSFGDNAQRILDIYFSIKKTREVSTPADVALFMLCVKLGREGTKPKRDNRVDAAGYIELWDQEIEKGVK
jgi:hypothetical protein